MLVVYVIRSDTLAETIIIFDLQCAVPNFSSSTVIRTDIVFIGTVNNFELNKILLRLRFQDLLDFQFISLHGSYIFASYYQ